MGRLLGGGGPKGMLPPPPNPSPPQKLLGGGPEPLLLAYVEELILFLYKLMHSEKKGKNENGRVAFPERVPFLLK